MTESALAATELSADVDARLREVLETGLRRSRAFAAPYSRLWDALLRMAEGGKKIRPRLLLGAFEGFGGRDQQAAVDAACAIELLHMALVIHDDVIDKDLTRRGEMNISGEFALEAKLRGAPSAEAHAWGESTALLAGDLVLTLAHSLLARLAVPDERRRAVLDIFDDTVFESAAGEHHDVWLSMRLDESEPDDVIEMLDHKTAAYSFEAPLRIAGVLADAPADVLEELCAVAREIGVIYQLRDDVLGVFGDAGDTGKSTLSDLREGKETLLIAHARTDHRWDQIAHLFGDGALTPAGAQRIRAVLEDSGARRHVEDLIAQRCVHVHETITATNAPRAVKDHLIQLAALCSTRNS